VSGGILTFGSLFPGSLFTNGAIAYWLHSLQCVIGHGQHTTLFTSYRNLLVVSMPQKCEGNVVAKCNVLFWHLHSGNE